MHILPRERRRENKINDRKRVLCTNGGGMDRVTKGSFSLCVPACAGMDFLSHFAALSSDTVIASFDSELTIPCYQISIKAFIGSENPSLISASSNFIVDCVSLF